MVRGIRIIKEEDYKEPKCKTCNLNNTLGLKLCQFIARESRSLMGFARKAVLTVHGLYMILILKCDRRVRYTNMSGIVDKICKKEVQLSKVSISGDVDDEEHLYRKLGGVGHLPVRLHHAPHPR